jgi:hypothetical protein
LSPVRVIAIKKKAPDVPGLQSGMKHTLEGI